jgi:hypothetical protein
MPSWAIYGNERRRGMHEEPPPAGNLLTQPSAFDHADWTANEASVTPNQDGTGDQLIEASGGNFHFVAQSNSKAASAITYDLSVRAKLNPSDSRNRICLQIDDGTANGRLAVFDIQNGLADGTAVTGFGSTFTGGTKSIQSMGSGWYKCTLAGVTTGTEATVRVIFLLDADSGTAANVVDYSGNGTSSILIDQAVLVEA